MYSPEEWPGVGSERALIHGEKLTGTWYDRTAHGRAVRRGKDVTLENFAIKYDIPLARLPCLEDYSEEQTRKFYRTMAKDIEQETRERLRLEGRRPLGVKKVLRVNPRHRPADPKRGPRPLCHASTMQLRKEYKRMYDNFVSLYRQAVDRLTKGEKDVRFPGECFLPSFLYREGMVVSAAPA